MNDDNLEHFQKALVVNRSDFAHNITQIAGAKLVLYILRRKVYALEAMDDIDIDLEEMMVSWYNNTWIYIANSLNPFDQKMDKCIRNCLEKSNTDWHNDDSIVPTPDFVFDDLFKLLMGTVHIPLAKEITEMISTDDSVLTQRNDVKEILQHDQNWIDILKHIADICALRDVESQKVCDSIEEYSIPELNRQREAIEKAKLEVDVHSGVTFALYHQEPKKARIQTGDIQTLLCRMKQMC